MTRLVRVVAVCVIGLVVCLPIGAQEFNVVGDPVNGTAPDHGGSVDDRALGDVLNSFPDPPEGAWGLAFRNGNLWAEDGTGNLTEMNPDTGAVISTLATGLSVTAGLGYDGVRDLFIICDPGSDLVYTVNATTGAVVNSWAAPSTGAVGAAYDSGRDGYWISDWESNRVDLMDATSGTVTQSCTSLPAGSSRLAGTGYAPDEDRIVYNSRDNGTTYIINASDCSAVDSFSTPGGAWGSGVSVRPTDFTIYAREFNTASIYVVDSGGLLPVDLSAFVIE